jgi:hypothetical protein
MSGAFGRRFLWLILRQNEALVSKQIDHRHSFRPGNLAQQIMRLAPVVCLVIEHMRQNMVQRLRLFRADGCGVGERRQKLPLLQRENMGDDRGILGAPRGSQRLKRRVADFIQPAPRGLLPCRRPSHMPSAISRWLSVPSRDLK